METQILLADKDNENEIISIASTLLKEDALVALPTETVYGLGANALSENAVKKIFEAKGRPGDNPLIVHIADFSDIYELVESVPKSAKKLAQAFWPGPLTIILKKSEKIPDVVSGGLDSVAIRIPNCDITRKIIRNTCPVAAPSANISGSPSPTDAKHVFSDMNGKIPLIVDGGGCDVGLESTVLSLTDGIPTILRPGVITKEEIEKVIGETTLHKNMNTTLKKVERAASPGMKYKHYSPKTNIVLLDLGKKEFIKFLNLKRYENIGAFCFDDEQKLIPVPSLSLGNESEYKSHAYCLFAKLRECDSFKKEIFYVRLPQKGGFSLAIYNRLLKAAGHQIEKPSMPKIIGITGSSGAGKSFLSNLFAEKGFIKLDADLYARKAVEKGSDTLKKLGEAFGADIVTQTGELDRKRLAKIAFETSDKAALLNSITHPAIAKSMLEFINEQSSNRKIVMDAPLLFESGLHLICDKTIGVISEKNIRIKRLLERDNISKEDILIRLNAEKNDDYYREQCDIIINGDYKNSEILLEKSLLE